MNITLPPPIQMMLDDLWEIKQAAEALCRARSGQDREDAHLALEEKLRTFNESYDIK